MQAVSLSRGARFGAACLVVVGLGCDYPRPDSGRAAPSPVSQEPSEPRTVIGRVLDRTGAPISGARIESVDFHPGGSRRETSTSETGRFELDQLVDSNCLLSVEAGGYYSEVVPLYLQGDGESLELPPLYLVDRRAGRARLWLVGDTMFGRRFEDRDEDGRAGEEADLIVAGRRADDAFELFRYLMPVLSSADYRVANFESPASTAEESRHPFKQYSFTSHPETLDGLARAGLDAVSLGNNHSYDYLEAGRIETEAALRERGIAFFGSGASETEARGSLHEVSVNGLELSFQGYNGIKPSTYYPDPSTPWPHEYLYYAMDEPRKGGALLLSPENLDDFLARTPGRLKIPVMHGGKEYGTTPTGPMRDRFQQAHAGGSRLVVAHHSHTVYGVALWGDEADPSLSFLSLGNFIFDQDVFETFNSFMALVDVDRVGDGYRLAQVRLMPFHQENYRPSLIAGEQAEWLARHVAHISTYLPEREEDDLRGAVAFADGSGIGVMLRPTDYRSTSSQRDRTVEPDVVFSLNDGVGPADFLAGLLDASPGARLRLASDRLVFGDFEDYDLDASYGENDHWWQTDTRYPTSDQARSGRHSIALYRERDSDSSVNTQLRNRLTFEDGEELSLGCWFKGENAGRVDVRAEYVRRGTRRQIGQETLTTVDGGSYDWKQWNVPLDPTPGAGHLRFVITMQAPDDGLSGTLYVDDCTLLAWGPTLAPGDRLRAPHGYTHGRFQAASPGEVAFREERASFERAPSSN